MKTKFWTKQAIAVLALIILVFAVATLLPVDHDHDGVTNCAVCCIISSAKDLIFAAFVAFFVFLPSVLFFFVAISIKKYNSSPVTPVTLKVKLSD